MRKRVQKKEPVINTGNTAKGTEGGNERKPKGTGRLSGRDQAEEPEGFFEKILESGVSRELLAPVFEKVEKLLESGSHGHDTVREFINGELADMVRCETPFRLSKGAPENEASGRKVAVIVGPAGSGKTTTLAKLATNIVLRNREKAAFLTADTYRIAATQQLTVLGDIIGIPTDVVYKVSEVPHALDKYDGVDALLVDTAGHGAYDNPGQSETNCFINAMRDRDPLIFLALPANLSLDDMRHTARSFSRMGATHLIFTKTDETIRYGNIFTVAVETGLPVAYISNGQNIPDDIIAATPEYMARLVADGPRRAELWKFDITPKRSEDSENGRRTGKICKACGAAI